VTLATTSLVQAAVYGVDDVPATTTVITAVVLSVLAFVLTMPSHVAAAPRPRAAGAAQASGVLSPRVVENTPHCKFVRSDHNTRRCEVSTAVSICPPPPTLPPCRSKCTRWSHWPDFLASGSPDAVGDTVCPIELLVMGTPEVLG